MNIIVVHNGTIQKIFTESGEDFIVIEGGVYQDRTMREIKSAPLAKADGCPEIELTGQIVAKCKDLCVYSELDGYIISKGDKEVNLGEGRNMFSLNGKPITSGSLLFQANLLPFLMDPETKKVFHL